MRTVVEIMVLINQFISSDEEEEEEETQFDDSFKVDMDTEIDVDEI